MHGKEVITEKISQAVKCNCINKPDCPFSNQCQIINIIYKAKMTSNPRIPSECGVIQAKATPNANNFHAVDNRTFLRYFNTTVL